MMHGSLSWSLSEITFVSVSINCVSDLLSAPPMCLKISLSNVVKYVTGTWYITAKHHAHTIWKYVELKTHYGPKKSHKDQNSHIKNRKQKKKSQIKKKDKIVFFLGE